MGHHLGGQVSKIRLSIAEYYVTRYFYLKVEEQLEFMGIFRCGVRRSHACSRMKLDLGRLEISDSEFGIKILTTLHRLSVVIQRYFLRPYVVESYFSIVCLENADLSCYHANVNTPLYKAVLSTACRVHSGRANHFSSIAREFDMLTRVHVLHYHEVYSKRPVHNRRKIHVERCSQYRQNNYEAVSAAQNIQVRLVEIAFSPC